MSEDAERIRQRMQYVRKEMGAGMHDVVKGARQLSDWKYYVRRHPWICVGTAAALGFLVSPGRRKLVSGGDGEIAKFVAQLKQQGVDPRALGVRAAGGGGLASKAFAVLWPILLRNASDLVAHRFANRDPEAPADQTSAESFGGP